MNTVLQKDCLRYSKKKLMPRFQIYYRKLQNSRGGVKRLFYKVMFVLYRNKCHVDLSEKTQIGEGLYLGHPFCTTINPNAIIGKNCNIHKGVTIGQENRGKRKGAPVIGDHVWIGVNSTIVGKVTVGNDVLIAPNTYVNVDIPDHAVVFGNPCIIKHKEFATEGYIIDRSMHNEQIQPV